MAKINPYAENTPGAALEAMYNACGTCAYACDHRMMIQCCHPDRANIMVRDIQGRPEVDEEFPLQSVSNYCVESNWWCSKYESVGFDNSPGEYKKKKTSAGAVGGATAGNPHPGNYGAKRMEKDWHNPRPSK